MDSASIKGFDAPPIDNLSLILTLLSLIQKYVNSDLAPNSIRVAKRGKM